MHHSFFYEILFTGLPCNKNQRKAMALMACRGVPRATVLMWHSPKQQPNPFQSLWKHADIITFLLIQRLVAQTLAKLDSAEVTLKVEAISWVDST